MRGQSRGGRGHKNKLCQDGDLTSPKKEDQMRKGLSDKSLIQCLCYDTIRILLVFKKHNWFTKTSAVLWENNIFVTFLIAFKYLCLKCCLKQKQSIIASFSF